MLTQCELPFVEPDGVEALTAAARAVRPGLEVVPTVFRPRPASSVRGRRVAFFTTAPEVAAPRLAAALAEDHGADVVLVSCDLADRGRLRAAVRRAAAEADVFLTEIKAAAVDVVAEGAAAAGRELVFCDNEPVALRGDLAATVDRLAALAAERFAARAGAGRGRRETGGRGVTVDEYRDIPLIDEGDQRAVQQGAHGADAHVDRARARTRLQRGGRRGAAPAAPRAGGPHPRRPAGDRPRPARAASRVTCSSRASASGRSCAASRRR